MDVIDWIFKSIQGGNTALAIAIVSGAALYGIWQLAMRFLRFLTTLFKNTNAELCSMKEMFVGLTKEVEKLNLVLEKTVELSSQRFGHLEHRVSRLENRVDVLQDKD